MIIEKLHIENFGKLHDFSLSFDDGFNLVFGNNEDGKTTIMSFIRMMFYGSGTQKNDISLNLRRRYVPFSGEKMGGSIEFSHGGKSYILSKQFGKSQKSDKTVLIEKGMGTAVTLPADKDVGEIFFSLGAGAFERSIYIGSLPAFSDDGTEELSGKLASSVYISDSGEGYEQIVKRIQKAQTGLRTPRKVGLADRLEGEIHSLERELDDAKILEDTRLQYEKSIKEKTQNLEALKLEKEQLESALNMSRAAAQSELIKSELEARTEADLLKNQLTDITADTLNRSKALLGELNILKTRIEEKTNAVSQKADAESLENIDDSVNNAWEDFQRVDVQSRDIIGKISALEERLSTENKASASSPIMFVVAFLFLISAVVGYFSSPVFLSMLAPAIIFFIIAITNAKKQGEQKNKHIKLREQLINLKNEELSLRTQRTQAESVYNMRVERKKLMQSDSLEKQKVLEKTETEISSLKTQAENTEKEIFDILGVNVSDAEKKVFDLEQKLNRLDSLYLFLSKSPLKDVNFEELSSTLKQNESSDTALLKTEKEYEKELSNTADAIKELDIALERERTVCENIFKGKRSIAVLERLICERKERLTSQNAHFEALQTAKDVLFEAYTDMRQNFAPELNRLTGELLASFTDENHINATVSNDFSVRVTQKGNPLPFESEYLSAGTRDQLDFCLRIALSKITAGDQKLPLMLDDIFAQYDDDRTERAMAFLKQYSSENQILFFTCHGSIKTLAENINANLITL